MPPKPPVFRSIGLSLRDVASAAKALQAEFAIVFAAMLASGLIGRELLPDNPAQFQITAGFIGFAIGNALFSAAFLAPLAVLIHRRIILGENGGFANLPALRGRIAEFYVASVVLNIGLGVIILGLPIMATALGPSIALGLLFFFGFVLAIWIGVRLFLIFPAIAIDGPDKGVADAFRRSRGLAWRSFFTVLLLSLGLMLLVKIASVAAGLLSASAGEAAALIGEALANLITTTAAVAIASRFYIWRRDADGLAGSEETGEPAAFLR